MYNTHSSLYLFISIFKFIDISFSVTNKQMRQFIFCIYIFLFLTLENKKKTCFSSQDKLKVKFEG